MSLKEVLMCLALASVSYGCGSENGSNGAGVVAGEWQAFLPRFGEFSQEEYRLFLHEEGEELVGRLQIYNEDVNTYFDGSVRLFGVEFDETTQNLTFYYARENIAPADLELKATDKLVGNIGDGFGVVPDAAIFTRLGDVHLCDTPCYGEYCDMMVGICTDCGNQDCDLNCSDDSHCTQLCPSCEPGWAICHPDVGQCFKSCEMSEDCYMDNDCIDGVCAFEGQLE